MIFTSLSIANPPGYGRPKTLATLSRLSPKASSNVSPIISKINDLSYKLIDYFLRLQQQLSMETVKV